MKNGPAEAGSPLRFDMGYEVCGFWFVEILKPVRFCK